MRPNDGCATRLVEIVRKWNVLCQTVAEATML
jgi:hypothetical protein